MMMVKGWWPVIYVKCGSIHAAVEWRMLMKSPVYSFAQPVIFHLFHQNLNLHLDLTAPLLFRNGENEYG